MIFDPMFHLLFFILNCFQFEIFEKRRFFVHTHTTFDVCVLTILSKTGFFYKIFLRQKKCQKKVFGGNFCHKIFFKIKNIKNF